MERRLITALIEGNLAATLEELTLDKAALNRTFEFVSCRYHSNTKAVFPLYLAAEFGHADAVVCLIGLGADVNKLSQQGYSALWVACARGHLAVVKVLLKAGAKVDCQEMLVNSWKYQSYGKIYYCQVTPLRISVEQNHLSVVACLLRENLSAAEVNGALLAAVQAQNSEMVGMLLDCENADVMLKTHEGYSAVTWALQFSPESLMMRLLKRVKDVNQTINENGVTLLHFLVYNCPDPLSPQHIESINFLISKGANVDLADSEGNSVRSLISSNTSASRLIGSSLKWRMKKAAIWVVFKAAPLALRSTLKREVMAFI